MEDKLIRTPKSLFDLFRIGIGPSSSHTVGPMRAAYRFVEKLSKNEVLQKTAAVYIKLFGSLALTGLGHGTDRGVLLGLMGKRPDDVDPAEIEGLVRAVRTDRRLLLFNEHEVPYEDADIAVIKDALLPGHSNGMRFTALAGNGKTLDCRVYSVGDGFVIEEGEQCPERTKHQVLYPFQSATELLRIGEEKRLPMHLIMLINEVTGKGIEEPLRRDINTR